MVTEAVRPVTAGRWLVLATVLIGTFVGTVNNSVVNVALPGILDYYGIKVGEGIWAVTIYVLLFSVLMPVAGKLGDLYGAKRVYLAGMTVFAIMSTLTALAPTFPLLIVFRGLQGVSNAPVLPTVMVIIATVFPAEERGRAMGLWAAVNSAGIAAGPPLGGFLTHYLGWQSVFFFNVPICALALVLGWKMIPERPRQPSRGFDYAGAAGLVVAVTAFMLALTQGATWGWASALTLGVLALSIFLTAVFVLYERRVANALVNVRLYRNWRYSAATIVAATQMFALYVTMLLLPLFLIRVRGHSSDLAGLLLFVLPLTMMLASPFAGRLTDVVGARLLSSSGMVLFVAVSFGLSRMDDRVPDWLVVLAMAIMGLGVAGVQSPVAVSVTALVPPAQAGVALGLYNMFRFVGGVLGTTLAGTILQSISGLGGQQVGGDLPVLLLAFRTDFYVLAGFALVGLVFATQLPGPLRASKSVDPSRRVAQTRS